MAGVYFKPTKSLVTGAENAYNPAHNSVITEADPKETQNG